MHVAEYLILVLILVITGPCLTILKYESKPPFNALINATHVQLGQSLLMPIVEAQAKAFFKVLLGL